MIFSFLRHSCRSHAWRLLPHHLRRVGSLFQAGFLHPSWSCMLPIFTNLSRHPSSACFLPPPKVSSLSNQTMLSKSILYQVLIPFLFLSSKDAKSPIRWPRLQHQPLPPPWCLLHFSDSFRFPPQCLKWRSPSLGVSFGVFHRFSFFLFLLWSVWGWLPEGSCAGNSVTVCQYWEVMEPFRILVLVGNAVCK